jgi:hypothetical protein
MNLKAVSAGFSDGLTASLETSNGFDDAWFGRGFNLASFDPDTFAVLATAHVDTYEVPGSTMEAFLKAVPDGALLVALVLDTPDFYNAADSNLGQGLKSYMASEFGATQFDSLQFRDSYAFVGYKGEGAVPVVEKYKPKGTGNATISTIVGCTKTPSPTVLNPPTSGPSFPPSPSPSLTPSSLPTAQPTLKPSPLPSAAPTPLPTSWPTPLPTSQPSPLPTLQPTPLPTPKPSAAPTPAPTPVPTTQPLPGVGVSGPAVHEVSEDGTTTTSTFTFALSTPPLSDVTVNFAAASGKATVSPAQVVFTYLDFNTPVTVTIAGVDDFIDQPGSTHAEVRQQPMERERGGGEVLCCHLTSYSPYLLS